jgi:hypothetical protein
MGKRDKKKYVEMKDEKISPTNEDKPLDGILDSPED